MLKMLDWRNLQIANQIGSPLELKSLTEKVTYSLDEIFSSYKFTKEPLLIASFASIAAISFAILLFSSPNFAIISGIITLTFVIAIPLSWNRYLLPVLPLIAITIGSLPSTIFALIAKLIKFVKVNFAFIKSFSTGALAGLSLVALLLLLPITNYLSFVVLIITLFLALQGFLVTRSMLYGFSHRDRALIPEHSPMQGFSLVVPARDESRVIGSTIQTLSGLNYPKDMYEVLVMIRADDYDTINSTSQAIESCGANNIRIVQIDGDAHNKSYSLNIGVKLARFDIIGIFDAEDEPHQDILSRVNDYLFAYPAVSAVQAPVHLTNLNSSWFSSLSATEYYYWFASVLPYLSTKGVVPLGGNTIFTKKEIYEQLGYYDETCLTEDADLGIRLAANHIKVGIITDPRLATREETPSSELEVIRQRSRWDQGYLQVLDKSLWVTMSLKQKTFALYTLTQPVFRHLSFLNMIFAPLLATMGSIPVFLALLSFIPSYFLILQLGLYLLGLAELSRLHQVKVSPWRYFATLLAFVPYQALLSLATLRAFGKMVAGNYSWDKTSHANAHRQSLAILEG
jgi:cellulose synthase/poly-beta-1,6-N-acetylglucosamine synthase-like glycosyltransferase